MSLKHPNFAALCANPGAEGSSDNTKLIRRKRIPPNTTRKLRTQTHKPTASEGLACNITPGLCAPHYTTYGIRPRVESTDSPWPQGSYSGHSFYSNTALTLHTFTPHDEGLYTPSPTVHTTMNR